MLKNKPLVSVFVPTYNQKDYIKQCLDSILSQETRFEFEVLINDDASTDGTTEIVREYHQKYPDIIKPVLHRANQYSKGKRSAIIRHLLPRAEGKYYAVCEGDDFWLDTTKLQRQVDFLESHHDYALVFHPVRVFFEMGEQEDAIFPCKQIGFTTAGLLKENFIQTNSVMYRAQSKDEYKKMTLNLIPGDWYIHLYHARFGKIGFINRVMSAYRRHKGGVWWGTTQNNKDEMWEKYGIAHLVLYMELLKIYGDTTEYKRIIDGHIAGTIDTIQRIDDAKKTNLLQTYLETYPEQKSALIGSLGRTIHTNHNLLEEYNNKLGVAEERLREASSAVENLEQERAEILSSKTYKVSRILSSAAHFIKKGK